MVVTRRPARLAAFGLALLGLLSAVSVTTPSRRAAAGGIGLKPTVVLVGHSYGGAVITNPLPTGGVGIDAHIDPNQFQDVFVGDVPAATATVMAASQRPLSLAAGLGKTREVAWKTIPSWYMVAHPRPVADLIRTAADQEAR